MFVDHILHGDASIIVFNVSHLLIIFSSFLEYEPHHNVQFLQPQTSHSDKGPYILKDMIWCPHIGNDPGLPILGLMFHGEDP